MQASSLAKMALSVQDPGKLVFPFTPAYLEVCTYPFGYLMGHLLFLSSTAEQFQYMTYCGYGLDSSCTNSESLHLN